jgi:hypothetical protein
LFTRAVTRHALDILAFVIHRGWRRFGARQGRAKRYPGQF